MDFENYDKAIQQADTELKKVRQKAENMIGELKQAASAYLYEFANYVVNRAVTDKPDVAETLGIEKLSQLKKQVSEVILSFPGDTDKRFDNVTWAHRTDIQGDIDSYSIPRDLNKKTSESLDDVIRELIGQIGSLLVEYGFAKTGQNSEWQFKTGKTLCYSYGLPDHEGLPNGVQLRTLKERYSNIIGEYVNATKILRKAQQDKKVAQAKDLWSRA